MSSIEERAAEGCERSRNPSLCLKEGWNSAFRGNLKAVCLASSLKLVRQKNVNLSDSSKEDFPPLPWLLVTGGGLFAHLC